MFLNSRYKTLHTLISYAYHLVIFKMSSLTIGSPCIFILTKPLNTLNLGPWMLVAGQHHSSLSPLPSKNEHKNSSFPLFQGMVFFLLPSSWLSQKGLGVSAEEEGLWIGAIPKMCRTRFIIYHIFYVHNDPVKIF